MIMITNIKGACGFIKKHYINIYNNKPYQLANLKTSISWQFSGLESEREMGNFYKIYIENYASIEKCMKKVKFSPDKSIKPN